MAYQPIKLSEDVRKKLNNHLKDLQAIRSDMERAKRGGTHIPQEVEDICSYCEERIAQLKKEWFKGKA
jgi:hypothetical protein